MPWCTAQLGVEYRSMQRRCESVGEPALKRGPGSMPQIEFRRGGTEPRLRDCCTAVGESRPIRVTIPFAKTGQNKKARRLGALPHAQRKGEAAPPGRVSPGFRLCARTACAAWAIPLPAFALALCYPQPRRWAGVHVDEPHVPKEQRQRAASTADHMQRAADYLNGPQPQEQQQDEDQKQAEPQQPSEVG